MPPSHPDSIRRSRPDRDARADEPAAREPRVAGITLSRAIWEREMRNLRTIVRLLAIVLAVLVARALLSGVTLAMGVAGATVAVLLLAALGLSRQGRRLELVDEMASADTTKPVRSR
jgi:hypothetical protein